MLAACAGAPAARVSSAPLDLSPAALRPERTPLAEATTPTVTTAAVDPCPSPQCGHTDTAVELELTSRRAEVAAFFQRYVQAITQHSTDALRPLLGETITAILPNPHNTLRVAREQVVNLHAALFESLDARGFEVRTTRLTSADDCRRSRTCNTSMTDGDWLVEWESASFRATPTPRQRAAPGRMIVRWSQGEPHAVSFSHEFLQPRGPLKP